MPGLMTFSDYSTLARRTECTYEPAVDRINPSVARLLHGALGLADEAAELAVAKDSTNLIEELGDLMWFTAVIADEIGFKPVYRAVPFGGVVALNHSVGVVASKVKAHVFYGRALDKAAIAEALQIIVDFVGFVGGFSNVTIGQITNANIRKLKVRFPDAFTEQNANSRNTEAEASAVKG